MTSPMRNVPFVTPECYLHKITKQFLAQPPPCLLHAPFGTEAVFLPLLCRLLSALFSCENQRQCQKIYSYFCQPFSSFCCPFKKILRHTRNPTIFIIYDHVIASFLLSTKKSDHIKILLLNQSIPLFRNLIKCHA